MCVRPFVGDLLAPNWGVGTSRAAAPVSCCRTVPSQPHAPDSALIAPVETETDPRNRRDTLRSIRGWK